MRRILFLTLIVLLGLPGWLSAKQYGVIVTPDLTATTADINGGTIDGVTIGGSVAPTVTDLGSVATADINGGTIDGVTIGGSVAPTVTDLGSVATADINGGTIDGTDVTVGAGKTLDVSAGTFTAADNQISGDKIDGGTISDFASTGIDDNATGEKIDITDTGVGLGRAATAPLDIYAASGTHTLKTESGSLTSGQSARNEIVGTGNSNARSTRIGVVYYDQSGQGGNNAPVSFLYLTAGDNVSSWLWADNSDLLRTSTTAAHAGSTNGTVVGDQSSDERGKAILPEFYYGIDDVMRLQPIVYYEDGVRKVGFGAQTTREIVPESVYDTDIDKFSDGKNTALAMKYVQIIPVNTSGIQDNRNTIQELQNTVNALKSALCSEHPGNMYCN